MQLSPTKLDMAAKLSKIPVYYASFKMLGSAAKRIKRCRYFSFYQKVEAHWHSTDALKTGIISGRRMQAGLGSNKN